MISALNSDASATSPPQSVTGKRFILVSLLAYWVLVMGMWGVFALDRGLTFETAFPVRCQLSLQQCLMYDDDLRPYNGLFLGVAYLLGNGNRSYVSYQLLYGFLWWSRGVLTLLIFRRTLPAYPIFGFLVGALVIVHASDSAVNWIGQLHQVGFMVFLALAIYFLIEGWLSETPWRSWLLILLALSALYISLWTYESHFFLILSVPLILLIIRPKLSKRWGIVSAIWYILPGIYGYLQIKRYLLSKTSTYQISVARADFNLSAITHDWLTHIEHSLTFWKWTSLWSYHYGVAVTAPVIASLCTLAFVVGCYLLLPNGLSGWHFPPTRVLLITLGVGLLWLLLSFPVYLLLKDNTNFWRTQMLSGFGSAIILVSGILLLVKGLPKDKYRAIAAISACSMIIFSGVCTGVYLQGKHAQIWQVHRKVMVQVSHLIPAVEDHTMILLTNVPKNADPFGAALWFDFPLRLLYPNQRVVGYFVYQNGDHPFDNPWMFTPKGMEWEAKGLPVMFPSVSYKEIIALRYNPDGKLSLLEEFPSNLLPEDFSTNNYSPRARIPKRFIKNRSIQIFGR